MEVIAIGPHDRSQNPLLVDQMHRLRARVFKERMGWDVTAIDGQEFDRFDELNPTSILVVDRGVVVGHTRVLPAIGPTMLSETFGFLASSGAYVPHSRMLETSRFCVDTSTARLSADGIHLATMNLIAGILEWADLGGYSEIVTVTDVRLERILRWVGLTLRRLGEPGGSETRLPWPALWTWMPRAAGVFDPANTGPLLPSSTERRSSPWAILTHQQIALCESFRMPLGRSFATLWTSLEWSRSCSIRTARCLSSG